MKEGRPGNGLLLFLPKLGEHPPCVGIAVDHTRLASSASGTDSGRLTDLAELLHHRFGFAEFRGIQQAVIERTVAGDSSLAVMPTGAGKSLTYQLGALARGGTGIVISPLIALMHDQVRSADAIGIRAAALTSVSEDPRAIRDALRNGELDLLYVAPERATGDSFAH